MKQHARWRLPIGRRSFSDAGVTARLLVLGVTLLLSLLGADNGGRPVWPALWLLAATAAVLWKFGWRRIDDPLVIVYTLGVLPMVGSLAAFPPTQYQVRADTVAITWVAAQTFLTFALLVGRDRRASVRPARMPLDPTFVLLLMLTSFGTQVAAFVYFAWTRGVPLLAFNAEQVRVDASSGAGPVVLVLTAAPLLTVVLLNFIPTTRWWQQACLLAIGVVALVLPALTGSRSALLKVLVLWVVCAYASRTIRYGTAKLASVMGAAIGAVWLLGTIRYTGSEQSFAMLLGQRLAADAYSADLILYGGITDPRVTGVGLFVTAFATYGGGYQPLVGDVLKELVGLDFEGGAIAVPIAAEGWLAAGSVGVIVFSVLAAAVPTALSRYADHDNGVVLTWSAVLAVTWAGVYGTGIATTLATYAVPTAVLLLVLYVGTWLLWRALQRVSVARARP